MALTAAIASASASAATLVGDYQFQGTLSSSGPGAALANIGPGTNSFQSETVMGTPRSVLAFPEENGVQMNPTGITPNGAHSVVTTFRFADVAGYNRIIDVTGGSSSTGFYVNVGGLSFYSGGGTTSDTVAMTNNVYATVAVVVSDHPPAGTAQIRMFANGSLFLADAGTFPTAPLSLNFFRDGSGVPEDSAGAVSCIRVFNGALTDAEVAAIGASPTCGATTAPAAKKKCKKKKQKRSAAAAKKKCKKKKKKR
jgi:hypothetical protein